MVAVGIILYAQTLLVRESKIRYLGLVLIAFLFHISALIALVFLPAYELHHVKNSTRDTINLLLVFGMGGMLLFYNNILGLLMAHGILSAKYSIHLTSGLNISAVDLALHVAIMGVTYFLAKYETLGEKTRSYYLEINVLNFAFLGVSFLSDTASRISLYTLLILAVVALPNLTTMFKKKLYRFQWRILLLSICVGYWIITICVQDIGQTYPYHSDIIQFLNLF